MRKTLLLLALTALWAHPRFALALDVPTGKAGIIEAVLGKVSVKVGLHTAKAQVGQVLDFGSTLSTGLNGRVSLRHADNAVTRLAPNTELTLRAPGTRKGIFMALSKGFIRFLVGKRAPGEAFEVETNNAVAAVKGTDAGVGQEEGGKSRAEVYNSDHKDALTFEDLKTGQGKTLAPGEGYTYDGKDFVLTQLNDEVKKAVEKAFDGLPLPSLAPALEKPEVKGEAPSTEDQNLAGDEFRHEAAMDAVNEAVESVMEDIKMDNFLARDERTGDLVGGRIIFDRNGTRTQVSSYIMRPEPDQVLKATYAKRLAGPFAGTSFAEETTTWNAALPSDWFDVTKLALDDPANLDKNGYPIFYRMHEEFIAGNPQGDRLGIITAFDTPLYQGIFNGTDYIQGPIDPNQGFTRQLFANDFSTPLFTMQNYRFTTVNLSSQTVSTGGYMNASWNTTQSATGDGGVSISHSSGATPFLTLDFRVLDDNGGIYDMSALASDPKTMPYTFKGLDNSVNLEVTLTCPGFSAPIDLMFIPEIFDAMDMLALPTPFNAGG